LKTNQTIIDASVPTAKVGTGLVSILLIAGALGVGSHPLSLLSPFYPRLRCPCQQGPIQPALLSNTAAAHGVRRLGLIAAHSHVHAHGHVLDLNVASIVLKEWFFRTTRKVADQENSPVLFANAHHHRCDGYSSVVGSGWFPCIAIGPYQRCVLYLHSRHLPLLFLPIFFFFWKGFFGFCSLLEQCQK